MNDLDSSGKSYELPEGYERHGFFLRMFPEYELHPEGPTGEISRSSWPRWPNSGTAWRGLVWMHNGSDWRSGGSACLLSAVLEPHVHPKYFLSQKACQGILRRAEKRGKELPEILQHALRAVAQGPNAPETQEDKTT